MKTNTNFKNSELQNRTAPRKKSRLLKVDFAKRQLNRGLPTDEVLNLLEQEAPLLLRMTQIVGHWLWLEFPQPQSPDVTAILSQIGFHWNKHRVAWQHPCGHPCQCSATYDPRKRYGCKAAI